MRTQPDIKKARRLLAVVVVLVAAVSASLGAYALSGTPEEEPDIQEGAITLTTPQTDLDVEQAVDPSPILTSPDEDMWVGTEEPAENLTPQPTEIAELPPESDPVYTAAVRSHQDSEDALLAWPFAIDPEAPQVKISCLFGSRIHPITGQTSGHDGVDFPQPQDTPVLAAAAGVVTESCYDYTLGRYVVLDHGNGMTTLYAHMTGDAMPEVGDQVEAGAQIGAVGSTGSATGPHLHFEVQVDGTRVDPLNYLSWASAVATIYNPKTQTLEPFDV